MGNLVTKVTTIADQQEEIERLEANNETLKIALNESLCNEP